MSDNSTIYFSKWILMPDSSILENGVIKVTGDTIDYVGSRSGLERNSNDRVVNLGSRIILPGLINMHTHLEEGVLRGRIEFEENSFTSWVNRRAKMMKEADSSDLLSSVRLGIRESLANGITSIVDTSSRNISPILFRDEPVRSWVIHEAEPGTEDEEERLLQSLEKRVRQSRRTVDHGIAPYSIFAMPITLQKMIINISNKNGTLWACHLAESIDELQAFTEHTGELYHRITRKSNWSYGDDKQGPLYFAITRNLIPNRGILYHLNYASGDELSLLSKKNVSIVISPQYSDLMGHRKFPLEVALHRKLNICIGTEAPLGFNAMNLLDELYNLKLKYPHIPATEMFKWITINPAKALGCQDIIGSLEAGKKADIIGIKFSPESKEKILEELLLEDPDINLVIVNGEELIIE